MLSLKNHFFSVEAFFKTSIVLTFAVERAELQNLIPECLELDTFNDRWAFIAVAVVETTHLRPKGFPAFMGNDFILIGFRIFVRYINTEGKRLRGLYILSSETNKRSMSFLGGLFTHYNYRTTDITIETIQDKISISSAKSEVRIEIIKNAAPVDLPDHSPFKNWEEARRFAGPLPFTFTYNSKTKEVLIIEGVRTNWVPRPVHIAKSDVGFITKKGFKSMVPANAFILENIPYQWKKGKIEIWKG